MSYILIARANDSERYLSSLDDEVKGIKTALLSTKAKEEYTLIEIPELDYESFKEKIIEPSMINKVKIFHYCGHSDSNGIAFCNEQGDVEYISPDVLSGYLSNQGHLEMVFLNSCFSESMAERLVEAGVPVVIGTTDLVNDDDSAILAATFYSLLASAFSIQEAFKQVFNEIPKKIKSSRGPVLDNREVKKRWKIYLKKSEYAERRLVKRSQIDELNDLDEDKHAVLLVYSKDEKGENYKHIIENFFSDQEVEVFLIWDFTTHANIKDREKAFKRLNNILYLATDSLNKTLNKELSDMVPWLKKVDQVGIVACDGNINAIQENLFKKELISNGCNVVPDIRLPLSTIRIENLSTHLKVLLKDKMNDLIGGIKTRPPDEDLFYTLDFEAQITKIIKCEDAFKKRPINFILIEGTDTCGQVILAKRIIDIHEQNINIDINKKSAISLKDNLKETIELNVRSLCILLNGLLDYHPLNITPQAFCDALLANLKNEPIVVNIHGISTIKEDFQKALSDFMNILNIKLNENEEELNSCLIMIVYDGHKLGDKYLKENEGKERYYYYKKHSIEGKEVTYSAMEHERESAFLSLKQNSKSFDQLNMVDLPVIKHLLEEAEADVWLRKWISRNRKEKRLNDILDKRREIIEQGGMQNVITSICRLSFNDIPDKIFDFI